MPRSMPLSEAIAEYTLHLEARGLEPRTIRNALQPLRRAVAEWGPIQTGSITGQHIDRLFRRSKWSPSTRNLYLGSLRGFFAWCRREGHIARDFDPTDGWKNARVPKRERLRVPVGEFPALLDGCHHPRDRMVCALGLYTFLRGGELATLTVGDLDLRAFTLNVHRHKTKEQDVLPVCAELAEEAERWLAHYRRDQSRAALPHWWMLVPSKHPNATRYNRETRQIEVVRDVPAPLRPEKQMTHPYRAVQRALKELGYDTLGEGEHTLRRSGARALFDSLRDQGYDGALMRVSSMLGHKDTKVTQTYLGIGLERIQRNESLAGKRMFGTVSDATILRLPGADDGEGHEAGM